MTERDNSHEAAEAETEQMRAWAEKVDAALPPDQPRRFSSNEEFLAYLHKLTPPGPIDYDRNIRLTEIAYKNKPAPPTDEVPEEAEQDHCARCGKAIFDAAGVLYGGRAFRFAQDWHGDCLDAFLAEHGTES